MRYLLDTHIFIWWIREDPRLPQAIRAVIKDPANELLLSAASTWEMVIKAASGKLDLPDSPERVVEEQLRINAVRPLPITIEHTFAVAALEPIHRDPFDRILVAQARCEGIRLLTDDPLIRKYRGMDWG